MKKERTFLHIDGDAFFAACTVALHPELEGLPVVTGYERGIATAISYEAKALGITRAMPIHEIKRQFPQVVIMESDYSAITIFSKRMINIVRRFSPVVEEYSIDECFADLTDLYASSKLSPIDIARKIQKEIGDNLNISVSVGIGPTKVLAKTASKYKKPHGITVITQENKTEHLSKVPVGDVWGIGRRTTVFLESVGVKTAQDFTELSEKWIDATLAKPFIELWHELRGNSLLRVHSREEAKDQQSISKTGTFNPPSRSPIYVFAELSKNIENACAKMRSEGLRGKRAVMFIKRQDFKYHSIECVVEHPTNSPEAFLAIAKERFAEIFKKGEDYRATGFTVYDLSPLPLQNDLFGQTESTDRFEKVHQAMDSIDQFFGKHTVHLGTTARALIRRKSSGNFFDRFAIPFGGSVV
ncbi:MAG: hypothetical protein RL641_805 [Candidatus Parcubacteria bacterium]|jgi:DNA polymerase-4/DNA polymerase V